MRTYTLASVERKIENYQAFIVRAEKKKAALPALFAIRDGILSPENLVKAETRLERMQKDIKRLEASVAASKAVKENRERLAESFPSDSDETGIGVEFNKVHGEKALIELEIESKRTGKSVDTIIQEIQEND